MLYFATPSGPKVRDVMERGDLGMISTPKQGNVVPAGVTWCADNGCFGKGYPGDDAWLAWLQAFAAEERARCVFAVVPDVVGDAAATLERSEPWIDRVRELGFPVAFVAQNGAETVGVPWARIDALFIGGDTEWKLGRHARALVAEAKRRGVHVHMGRVNSLVRLRYADAIGCDSADGTFLAFGPDRNLPQLVGWLRAVNETPALLSLVGIEEDE